jgi:hypothetical protein
VSQGTLVCSTRCFHAAPLSIIARGRPKRSEDVTDAVLAALADVSTLETLKLSCCRQVRDVSALARSVSLRELDLSLLRRVRCRHCGVGAHPIPHLAFTPLVSIHHERDEPVSLQVATQAGFVSLRPSPTRDSSAWNRRLHWNSSNCAIVLI